MKKHLPLSFLLFLVLTVNKLNSQNIFTINPQWQCFNGANTATVYITNPVTNASTYSWTILSNTCMPTSTIVAFNGSIAVIGFPCAGTFTVTGSAYNSSNAFLGSSMLVTNVYSPPTINVSASSSSPCAGASNTLCASGATTYTWMPGNLVGACPVIQTMANTIYTVVGSDGTCTATGSLNILAQPIPTVTIVTSNSVVCAGATVTLSVLGANSYTWNTGATAPTILVTPTAPTLYTVTGTNGSGCNSSTSAVVIVNPTPTLTVNSPTALSICAGDSVTASITGATSYVWYPGALTTPVYPTSNTCYTVLGNSQNGCASSVAICVTVNPLPIINISGSPVLTVCAGSGATLNTTGAATSFAWNNGVVGPLNALTPTLIPICLIVQGTDANGCKGYDTICVNSNTTCSNVWPGDANNDGVVNSADVFEIGLGFNSTGPARSPGGNTFTGQFASNWTGTVSTGKNLCHADCDGSGTIDLSDTVAIYNNFSLTHSFKPGSTSALDIYLSAPTVLLNSGQWNMVEIFAGHDGNVFNQLYGLGFDIDFDQSLVENNSAYIVYTPSFLNASNQNVEFRKTVFNSGKIHAVSVRTDGTNIAGIGKIGEFHFKVKPGSAGSVMNLAISNGIKTDQEGIMTLLSSSATSITIIENPVGLSEISHFENSLAVYPNPVSGSLNLFNSLGTKTSYVLVNVLGQEFLSGEFSDTKTLDASSLTKGTYFIRFESAGTVTHKKVLID